MAKPIMIQGTMSDVGKSLLTAGLCRIFAQDGYTVAPFKSQNMALNSFVTLDNLEIGRAQAMQAEAANKEPDVRMNPILLKPTSDKTSQVIVNGEVVKNMGAVEYYDYKNKLTSEVKKSYESLASENDIIVIEGAGSPAEINLNAQDIVNMGMARIASSPVLLVGDIDRGGVFASLYGTIALLPKDRVFFKGFIINKFRGDQRLLMSGIDDFSKLMQINSLGVVPFMDIDIDEEDSSRKWFATKHLNSAVNIAVIRLPHIANFTDFTPFERVQNISLHYISKADEVDSYDLIIIPGSKNTMGDLLWIRENGLENAIKSFAKKSKPIIGICGGYQMLSKTISDIFNTEHGGVMDGMGLLDIETVFLKNKTRTRVTGKFKNLTGIFSTLNNLKFEGYEIHLGETSSLASNYISTLTDRAGAMRDDGINEGNIYGSYVHGIFDNGEIVNAILKPLFEQKGLNYTPVANINLKDYKNSQYDKLAEILRHSLDIDMIYDIIKKGVGNG